MINPSLDERYLKRFQLIEDWVKNIFPEYPVQVGYNPNVSIHNLGTFQTIYDRFTCWEVFEDNQIAKTRVYNLVHNYLDSLTLKEREMWYPKPAIYIRVDSDSNPYLMNVQIGNNMKNTTRAIKP